MNATDPNFFILIIIGACLVYGLAPAFFPALVILGGLWLIAKAPVLGVTVAIVLPVLWILRTPIRWFFEGLFISEGVKLSGILRPSQSRRSRRVRLIRSAREGLLDDSRQPPQPRYRRGDAYQPWDVADGDDFPESLPPPDARKRRDDQFCSQKACRNAV